MKKRSHSKGLKRREAAEQWVPCKKVRPVLTTKENLTQREGTPLALPPAQCTRQPNLILLIDS